jgi:hypothetical protein
MGNQVSIPDCSSGKSAIVQFSHVPSYDNNDGHILTTTYYPKDDLPSRQPKEEVKLFLF